MAIAAVKREMISLTPFFRLLLLRTVSLQSAIELFLPTYKCLSLFLYVSLSLFRRLKSVADEKKISMSSIFPNPHCTTEGEALVHTTNEFACWFVCLSRVRPFAAFVCIACAIRVQQGEVCSGLRADFSNPSVSFRLRAISRFAHFNEQMSAGV